MTIADRAKDKFIACGMYAFNDELRAAWQALFTRFIRHAESTPPISPEIVFDAGESVLRDPAMLLGHTCGYPLMTRYAGVLEPIAAPVFDAEGCDGLRYSSHFIVAADSGLESLEACRGRVVAINGYDSNSGMNVLRHALAALDPGDRFFSGVEVTGGHRASVEAVAAGRADLAAIDCVTLALLGDADPGLVARVRSIGSSARSTGLPFVVPAGASTGRLAAALAAACAQLPKDARRRLRLVGIEPVTLDDYASIVTLEHEARDAGYKRLQ